MVVENLKDLDHFVSFFLEKFPRGAVVCLSGTLGAGKTTFVRHVAHALSRKLGLSPPRVTSPTYVLHQNYATQPPIEHFDLYRVENCSAEGLTEMGYFDALERARCAEGYLFVEWPEQTQHDLLECDAHLRIELRETTRHFSGI